MSKQTNKAKIGAFVVGAVALVVVAIVAFGSGKFLTEKQKYVMYFEDSVNGLDVGASVMWRGVEVGTVTDIVLRADPVNLTIEIPVFIEIETNRMEQIGDVQESQDAAETMRQFVDKGLRAQLVMQNYVTGKLMIELDCNPDKPVRLIGHDPEYPEIPTMTSNLAELAQKIEKAPIEEILEKLHSAVDGIEKVVTAPEVLEAVHSFDDVLMAAKQLIEKVDAHVDPLLNSTEETVRDARNLVRNVDGKMDTLAIRTELAIKEAFLAMEKAKKALDSIEKSVGEDSILLYEVSEAIQEISAASRSIRQLADYLSQHPESLLRGKGGAK